MMRLTVHVEDAPFVERERKLLGKDLQGKDIFKPKKSKCIRNTLSFKNLKSEKEVLDKLVYVKSKYKIAKYKEKKQHTYQNGKEMIYVSYC
jgi:hypothetical protein